MRQLPSVAIGGSVRSTPKVPKAVNFTLRCRIIRPEALRICTRYFFGEPAVTNTATSRLAKISGATVLAYFFRRLDDDSGYVVSIAPPLNDFPSDDPAEDTRRMVGQLEDYIRLAPEQYVWTYRRFKGRPDSYPDIYGPD